jgi:hypothetical protein
VDVQYGNVVVSSLLATSTIYSTAGTYTASVPARTNSVFFEMIGAGGFTGGTSGGQGGYIQGSISLPSGATSIKVVVGSAGSQITPSGASYINIPSPNPNATLFVMAGAGGAGGSGIFNVGVGGGGGYAVGGSGVAFGEDSYNFLNTSGAYGGTSVGGVAGLDCSGSFLGNAGANYAGLYEQALGGAGYTSPGSGTYAGGSGYTGGGSGCGAGGGSSYVNPATTFVTLSYSGSLVPVGVLSGYGRANQSGYVSVTFVLGPSLDANGDILCRSISTTSTLNTVSTLNASYINTSSIISSASGKILLGTGTPTYRFEINNGGQVSTFFNTGFRFTSANQINNVTSNITETIQLKTDTGIWAANFYATSDKRIKKNICDIKEEDALEVIRQLRPVTYQYIDRINRSNEMEYGFLAQDVSSVLPYAITKTKDFIPNIYDLAQYRVISPSTSLLILQAKTTEGLELHDTLKLIDTQENSIIASIVDRGISSIVIDKSLPMSASGEQENQIFVYGKEVNDLHVLEKQAIFSVGTAALQKMNVIVQQQRSTINRQHSTIMHLYETFKQLENETESMK